MSTRTAVVVLSILPLVSLQHSRAAQGPSQTVIRTSTRLVQVSVIATDKAGGPVADLTRADFQLTEDGKPQQIRFLSLEKGEEVGTPSKPLPAGISTNRLEFRGGVPKSATVLLFDGLNTPPGYFGRSRAEIEKFLRQTNTNYRIAIYALGRQLRVLHDFTSDTALLTKRLSDVREIFPDQAPQEWGEWMSQLKDSSDPDSLYRSDGFNAVAKAVAFVVTESLKKERDLAVEQKTQKTFEAIEAIARRLSVIPGRKNLVWVSTGFPLVMALDTPLVLGRRGFFGPAAPPRQRSFTSEFERAMRALNDASVAVYPVDARGLLALSAPTLQTNSEATLKDLATRTGGKLYVGKEVHEALPEILAHARVSYTLAYYPGNQDYDGKFRQIRLKTGRPGIKLSYRTGYYALPDTGAGEEQQKAELLGAVWSPVDATAIGLDVMLERSAGDAAEQRTLVVQVDGKSLQFVAQGNESRCRLQMFVVQKNGEGAQVDGMFDNIEIRLPQEKVQALQQRAFTHRKELRLKSEASVLRVVVRNASGALGSLSIRLR